MLYSQDVNPYFFLGNKESVILEQIIRFESIKNMSFKLHLNERTVKYRISKILLKTKTSNQKELVQKFNSVADK